MSAKIYIPFNYIYFTNQKLNATTKEQNTSTNSIGHIITIYYIFEIFEQTQFVHIIKKIYYYIHMHIRFQNLCKLICISFFYVFQRTLIYVEFEKTKN